MGHGKGHSREPRRGDSGDRTSDLGYLGRFPQVQGNLLEESGERLSGLWEGLGQEQRQTAMSMVCLETGKFREMEWRTDA